MKRFRFISSVLFSFLIFSCNNSDSASTNESSLETPKALQEQNLEISSFKSRSVDLVDQLYYELMDKNETLKKLDEDMISLKDDQSGLKDKFNLYDDKSSDYYTHSNKKANSIKDSILRERILKLIRVSEKNYANKVSRLKSLIDESAKEDGRLEDYYTVLKVVTTIPFIEKYQNSDIPSKGEYIDLINKQKLLEKRIDSLLQEKNKF